ncbi:MAG: hypothetical protein NC308_05100 [Clostridium sp.]|nr:hypothetical protein [Bacteroides sp.]MCM1198246.1 hypothetical protein [Clostridium sp.]
MKKIFSHMLTLATVFAVQVSCTDKVDRDVAWPQWASRPVIEDAGIYAGGMKTVVAGKTVKFSARIHDEFTSLKEYSLTVKYGTDIVFDRTVPVSGNEAAIDIDVVMPFAAYLDSGYPEVTLSVTNSAGGSATCRIPNDRNVTVVRPESPEVLYIVGTNGKSAVMERAAGDYSYILADPGVIASVGERFYVAEKLNGVQPDFSAPVWGENDGNLVVVGNDGDPIRMPDSSGKGFKRFGFNIYTFCIDKMVDYTVVIDRSLMEEVEQSGVNYLAMEGVGLVRDCEVVFSGFGDLGAMLQPDRFEIIDANTAKFTGHTQDWNIYYDVDDNWMIVNYAIFNTSGQVWVTGMKACFPLGDGSSAHELKYLEGDGKVRYATLAAVKDGNGVFSIALYLKEDFTVQLYRWVKWSTTVSMVSLTPETAKVTDDMIYIRPGSSFTPGVYLLEIEFTAEADAGGDGSKANISVKPFA